MKTAPFSATPVYLVLLATSALLGAIVGWLLSSIGQGHWIVGMLCGLLPFFVAGPVRVMTCKALASTQNLEAEPPMAFSFPVRFLIAAVVSIVAAYVMLVAAQLGIGALSGGLIGLLTGAVVGLILTMRIVTSD